MQRHFHLPSTAREDRRIAQVAGSAQFDGARRSVGKLELEKRVGFDAAKRVVLIAKRPRLALFATRGYPAHESRRQAVPCLQFAAAVFTIARVSSKETAIGFSTNT